MTKGKFISFEGIDGCGKTTQINKLEKYLSNQGIPCKVAKEPGSTAAGGALRRLIKYPDHLYPLLNIVYYNDPDFTKLPPHQKRTHEAELLMFLAARAEYMAHIVEPNLADGIWMLSDRFADSTRGFQGGGRYHSDPKKIEAINYMNNFVIRGRWPDLTILLDIDFPTMVERLKKRTEIRKDFMEQGNQDFYQRIIEEYRSIAEENPERVIIVNGDMNSDDIFECIKQYLPLDS